MRRSARLKAQAWAAVPVALAPSVVLVVPVLPAVRALPAVLALPAVPVLRVDPAGRAAVPEVLRWLAARAPAVVGVGLRFAASSSIPSRVPKTRTSRCL